MFSWGRKKKKIDAETRKKTEDFGLYVRSGEQLDYRIQKQKELSELIMTPPQGNTPEEKILALKERVNKINALVREISTAWMRAGSDQRFRRAVGGYENLFRTALRDCDLMLDDLVGKDDIEQRNIAGNLERAINLYFTEQALFLTDVSFDDKDVSITSDRILVIQQPPAYGGGSTQIIPTSSLPPTRGYPSDKPRPERLTAELEEQGGEDEGEGEDGGEDEGE